MEGPWVDGKPHGLCSWRGEFARGVGTFTHGELHGGPFWFKVVSEFGDGTRTTFKSMNHGRPVGIMREYCSDDN